MRRPRIWSTLCSKSPKDAKALHQRPRYLTTPSFTTASHGALRMELKESPAASMRPIVKLTILNANWWMTPS